MQTMVTDNLNIVVDKQYETADMLQGLFRFVRTLFGFLDSPGTSWREWIQYCHLWCDNLRWYTLEVFRALVVPEKAHCPYQNGMWSTETGGSYHNFEEMLVLHQFNALTLTYHLPGWLGNCFNMRYVINEIQELMNTTDLKQLLRHCNG